MSDLIQIAVVEDNPAYAHSIREIIECSDGMEFIAHYSTAEECNSAFQANVPPQVDIILLDLKLPGRSGMSLIPMLRDRLPEAGIIVLTSNDDYRSVLEAIQLGVVGYILKDTSVADLRRSIQDVHNGGSVIDPQLSRIVLKALSAGDEGDESSPLSQRERQVLELMAMGYVKKEVASELGISYSAVALYTCNIYEKLQVPNVAAAVAAAIRKGMI